MGQNWSLLIFFTINFPSLFLSALVILSRFVVRVNRNNCRVCSTKTGFKEVGMANAMGWTTFWRGILIFVFNRNFHAIFWKISWRRKEHMSGQMLIQNWFQLIVPWLDMQETQRSTTKGLGTLIQIKRNHVQLNKYETAPNFIQLNRNLTWNCLLI